MNHISTCEPDTIYFGDLSEVEKISMIRLWLLIYAFKYNNTLNLEPNQQTGDVDTESYLQVFINKNNSIQP